MKRVWIGLAVVLAVLVVGLVLLGTLLAREGQATFQKSQKQLADDWARWASPNQSDPPAAQ
jgi:type VI protein secretion system component VasF